MAVVLLTNRTWPDRKSQAIRTVRPAFHDAVMKALNGGVFAITQKCLRAMARQALISEQTLVS